MSKLTMIGMYNYDNTLFDSLTFPDGIEKDLAVDQILLRSGDFEVLYPEPDFLKFAIGSWGRKHYRTFSKWVEALAIDYDPLNNYDRTEETRDEHRKTFDSTTSADYNESRTVNLEDKRTADLTTERTDDLQDKRTADLTTERTDDLQDKRTADLTTERTDDLTDERTADLEEKTTHNTTVTTTQTADGTTQHDVAAYDSATLVPSWKDTVNTGANTVVTTGDETLDTTGTDTMTHTGTATTTETGTDTMDHTGTATTTETGTDTMNHTGTDKQNVKGTMSDVEGSEANTNIHTSRTFGNIGVTSSQQLLAAELDIQRFNLYTEIANLFIDDFCIQVYV